jgi:hypothetical protein
LHITVSPGYFRVARKQNDSHFWLGKLSLTRKKRQGCCHILEKRGLCVESR